MESQAVLEKPATSDAVAETTSIASDLSTETSHLHKDGTERSAISLEDARKVCPYLASLSIEAAQHEISGEKSAEETRKAEALKALAERRRQKREAAAEKTTAAVETIELAPAKEPVRTSAPESSKTESPKAEIIAPPKYVMASKSTLPEKITLVPLHIEQPKASPRPETIPPSKMTLVTPILSEKPALPPPPKDHAPQPVVETVPAAVAVEAPIRREQTIHIPELPAEKVAATVPPEVIAVTAEAVVQRPIPEEEQRDSTYMAEHEQIAPDTLRTVPMPQPEATAPLEFAPAATEQSQSPLRQAFREALRAAPAETPPAPEFQGLALQESTDSIEVTESDTSAPAPAIASPTITSEATAQSVHAEEAISETGELPAIVQTVVEHLEMPDTATDEATIPILTTIIRLVQATRATPETLQEPSLVTPGAALDTLESQTPMFTTQEQVSQIPTVVSHAEILAVPETVKVALKQQVIELLEALAVPHTETDVDTFVAFLLRPDFQPPKSPVDPLPPQELGTHERKQQPTYMLPDLNQLEAYLERFLGGLVVAGYTPAVLTR